MQKQLANTGSFLASQYRDLLKEIKGKVLSSQLKAAISVNSELIKLYWDIGHVVYQKQKDDGWGRKTIEKLAKDLKSSFSNMKGFSPRNLQYMVTFAREYPDLSITQQLVAQIPWGHNILLLDKLTNYESRIWYIKKTIENDWSRRTLLHWIENNLYKRQGNALSNFKRTLASPQSDLAHETLKDPYNFDFLTLRGEFDERELERGVTNN